MPLPQDKKSNTATIGIDELKDLALKMGDRNEPPKTGKRIKIMTPNQLVTRLPILLAQKQARKNSQKLKNEIRQIIYSLHRSKNLSKTLYNPLINTI